VLAFVISTYSKENYEVFKVMLDKTEDWFKARVFSWFDWFDSFHGSSGQMVIFQKHRSNCGGSWM